jgi:hypothetical protein
MTTELQTNPSGGPVNIAQEMINHLEAYSNQFRFIVEFKSQYVREENPNNVRSVVEQSWAGTYDLTKELIQKGIEDGPLRQDLDPGLVTAALPDRP